MQPTSPLAARWLSYGGSVLASDIRAWAQELEARADAPEPIRTYAANLSRQALDAYQRAHTASTSGDPATRHARTSAEMAPIYDAWKAMKRMEGR